MSRVIAREDAVMLAREQFLATGDVDIDALCRDLAVARATLYRVTGGRDRLLGSVLAELGERSMVVALESTAQHPMGVERVVQAAYEMNLAVSQFQPLRTLIQADPETAFRVLFTDRGGAHEHAVAVWTPVITEALTADGRVPSRAPDRLAYMFVRTGESMIFAELLAHKQPDMELAREVQRALLTLD